MNDFEESQPLGVDGATRSSSGVPARQRRWRSRRGAAWAAISVAVVVGVVSVGARMSNDDRPTGAENSAESATDTSTGTGASSATRRDPVHEHSNRPPPVVLRLPDGDVALRPWTYCWDGPEGTDGTSTGVCADGSPGRVADLADAAHLRFIRFEFGVDDWDFEAGFRQLGVKCPHSFTADATATSGHTFRLDPAGPAGRYQVDVSGRGEGGDVITSFVWTTTIDGPIDQPTATIAVVTDDEDSSKDLVAYGGLDLLIEDLDTTPQRATARVLVTAANGRSMTLRAGREFLGPICAEGGRLYFRGSDAQAQAVTTLGPTPFTYRVELDLDGQQYIGTAVWPRDEPRNGSASVPLRFDPPLPAYSAD